ncbi:MAG: hypothetical protein JW939_01740, partial [Candidatus Thermoplasmatota archaeon]|nr:hypothetical protein [Candidatus Thermoplasmatota archaeon]
MNTISEKKLFTVLVMSMLLLSFIGSLSSISAETRAPAIPDDYHPGIIRVSATYPNSTPAVCCDVAVYPYGKTTSVSTNCTDSSGFAELKVNFGDLGRLTVYLSQYSINLDKEHITLGPDDIVNIDMTVYTSLEAEVYINGTVRDAFTDWSLDGINLTLEGADHYGNDVNIYCLTASNGTFSFWVPISDQPYEISYSDDILYLSHYTDVFPGMTPGTVEHDIYLYPTYQPDTPFRVRFIDADSTDPYADGYLELRGSTLALDHASYTYSSFTNNSMDGWYKTYLHHGEYSLYWAKELEEYDVTVDWWSYFYVNYTEVSWEVPIDTPDWKLVELEVWNETSPYWDCYVTYDTRLDSDIGRSTAYSWNYTDTSGKANIYVPADRPTQLEIYGYYGGFISIEIDPTGPEPIRMNVTLETIEEPPVIEGDVRIMVKDRLTDAKVPGARIAMYYSEPDYSTLFYKYADINGEYVGKARAGHYSTVDVFCKFGEGYLDDLEVTASGTTEVTIYIDRYPELPEVNDVCFHLKDETGDPVPYQMLRINYKMAGDYVYLYLVSDEDGKVSFRAPSVEIDIYLLFIGNTYQPEWALPVKTWYAPEGGGQMDDVIVYPTTSMEEIWGFVKEKETGLPVQGASTIGYAFKLLEDVDEDFDPFGYIPEMPETAIPLTWVGTGSVSDGFYRFWGRDTTFVYCSAEGYFPIIDRIEIGTRADHRYDFLLEKIPPFDIFINGTLVDGNDEPVTGSIEVHDIPHDLYFVGGADTGPTGEFSFPAYPGIFRITFGNETIQDRMEIEVTEDGLDGLILKLVPKAMVWGAVTNWDGTIMEGVNVTIQRVVDDEHLPVDWQLTDEMGGFAFRVPAGDHRLSVEATELYEEYLGEPFTTNGWNDLEMNVRLENRTSGILEGCVLGEGGPFAVGIPEAVVVLSNCSGPLFEVFANESGFFSFGPVPYGRDYRLN